MKIHCSKTKYTLLCCALFFALAESQKPEQVHISLTENEGEMRVIWVEQQAYAAGNHGTVKWGESAEKLDRVIEADSHTYTAGGFDGTIFEAVMTNLSSPKQYYYVVGSNATSKLFNFQYGKEKNSIKILSYGDMGIKNSWTTTKMLGIDAATGDYDLTINVGDTSYADDYEYGHNAYVFDEHFRNIESHAAFMPFMTVPGNHERQYNFSAYRNRLRMPRNGDSEWAYSFDYGPAHFVVYSSEHSFAEGTEQWNFIKSDLAAASKPDARSKRPWIIMWSHRPLYCSDLMTWEERCVNEAAEYRNNIETLIDGVVDIHISGHNHQYERSWPVVGCTKGYKSGCEVSKSYDSPKHPVHIINGAGGDTEGIDPTWIKEESRVPFRAFNSEGCKPGYSQIEINSTTLQWTFLYSGKDAFPGRNASKPDGAGITDQFIITK